MACLPAVINHHQVCLEFAKPKSAQIQGLAGRKSIPDNYGLVFETSKLGKKESVFFTMSKMQFPIDMIFIKDEKIVLIEYAAKPCNVTPDKCLVYGGFPADYVIETNVGNANKWGMSMFDKFSIKAPNVK